MKIHHEELSDVRRYLDKQKQISLEEKKPYYRNTLDAVTRFKKVDANTRMIEIGTGTGWFPLICQQNGLTCEGLEISPQLIECANELADQYNLKRPDIQLGNLEDADLGENRYDVVIASNVFEHIEFWRQGIQKLALALKPGGALFFESSNKFSFTSGEYSGFPTYYCYGWLRNEWRYSLRKKMQGPDIMKLGIDFNQFRHSVLRREFEKAGFRQIYDRLQIAYANEATVTTGLRRAAVRWSRKIPPVKALALTFCEATRFVCLK